MISGTNNIFKVSLNILKKNNINYWICHGTLLGIIRDKKLLSWDNDIDFAVWEDEHSKEEILNIFSKDKRFNLELNLEEINSLHFSTNDKRVDINFYSRNKQKAFIKWMALPKSFLFKIFFFMIGFICDQTSVKEIINSNNKRFIQIIKLIMIMPLFIFKIIMPKSLKIRFIKVMYKKLDLIGYSYPLNLMKFKKIYFLGEEINVPIESENVLKYTYGNDWKIPKENYIWYKEGKNLFRQQ